MMNKKAFDVVLELLNQSKNIKNFFLIEYPDYSLLQAREGISDKSLQTIKKGESFFNKYSLPFWDSVLLASFDTPSPYDILKSSLFHNSTAITLKFEYSKIDHFESFVKDNYQKNLTFNSKVVATNGEELHFPMLDFHIPSNDVNIDIAIDSIKALKCNSGYLLDSGNSYHFYGTSLLYKDDWLKFMAKAILLAPIVDKSWAAHQIIEESASLRIGYKNKKLPELVHVF